MGNQHRHIKGYRDLSQTAVDLMNEIKAKGEELRELIERVRAFAADVPEETEAREADHLLYWARMADCTFRSGLMYLIRAVARPASY